MGVNLWTKVPFRTRVALVLGFAVLCGQCAYVVHGFFGGDIDRFVHARPFDSTIWKDRDTVLSWDHPIRCYMVRDLLRTHDLTRKSTSQIDTLLGCPDHCEKLDDSGYEYMYFLGPSSSFIKLDPECLVIRFERETVVDVRIR
jgi:hypothetical protein